MMLPGTTVAFGRVKLHQLRRWYINRWIGVTGQPWTLRMMEMGGYYLDDKGDWTHDKIDVATGNPFDPSPEQIRQSKINAARLVLENAARRADEAAQNHDKLADELIKYGEEVDAAKSAVIAAEADLELLEFIAMSPETAEALAKGFAKVTAAMAENTKKAATNKKKAKKKAKK